MPPKTRSDSTASDIDATMKEILQQLKRINNRIEIIEEKSYRTMEGSERGYRSNIIIVSAKESKV